MYNLESWNLLLAASKFPQSFRGLRVQRLIWQALVKREELAPAEKQLKLQANPWVRQSISERIVTYYMTCTTSPTWQTCASLLAHLGFQRRIELKPWLSMSTVWCPMQGLPTSADMSSRTAQVPRDSDPDAHVVCPGKILTRAEFHAFTLASSTVRSLATTRRALPGGPEVIDQSTRQSNELASKGPHLTRLAYKLVAQRLWHQNQFNMLRDGHWEPRPMAHRTIALTTELREPCCRGLHMVDNAKYPMLCVCVCPPSRCVDRPRQCLHRC